MKKINYYMLYMLFASILYTGNFSAQVINITTGIDDNTNSLLPVWSPDDDWTVNTYTDAPGVFVPVTCSSGSVAIFGPPPVYTLACYDVGSSIPVPLTTMRFLSPWMTPCPPGSIPYTNGAYDPAADAAYQLWQYYYKRTFNLTTCAISSASLIITAAHIGDSLSEFIINGHHYSVPGSYITFWGLPSSPVIIPISPSDLNAAGSNTIVASVVNKAFDTGMALEAQIVVVGSSIDPAFSLSFSGPNLVASSPNSGTHSWQVYGSSSGMPGSYSYVGTYATNPLSIPATMKCYYVKHTLQDVIKDFTCGPLCAAQNICKASCDEAPAPCEISAPSGLHFEGTHMSWMPVTGAASYILQLIPNDPDCCREGAGTQVINIPLFGTTHLLDVFNDMGLEEGDACFSWRIIPVCQNGNLGPASEKKCSSDRSRPAIETGISGNNIIETTRVNIFPNPSNGQVQLDVETASETQLNISIADLTGRVIKTFSNVKTVNQKSTLKWNTELISKGTYLVKIETADHRMTVKKLLIE